MKPFKKLTANDARLRTASNRTGLMPGTRSAALAAADTRGNVLKRSAALAAALSLLLMQAALAGEATTSASAGSNGYGPGTASATAGYVGGGPGIAQTQTRSGTISFGRGLAFGIDEDGVSFSASHAVAPRFGPAIASTFNLSLGFDGQLATSHGSSLADGSPRREAFAGGSADTGRSLSFGSPYVRTSPTAIATAGGRTGSRGYVQAKTDSKTVRLHKPYKRYR